jgi:hypothetical protein
LALLIGLGAAEAAVIPVENHSFEEPGYPTSDWSQIPGWDVDPASSTTIGVGFSTYATDGDYYDTDGDYLGIGFICFFGTNDSIHQLSLANCVDCISIASTATMIAPRNTPKSIPRVRSMPFRAD